MDFTEALYLGISQRRMPDSSDFGSLLGRLTGLAGSGAAAARVLGVSPTTLYRWRSGRQKPKTTPGVLGRAIRRLSLDGQRERQIRRGELRMVIHGIVRISKDVRRRKLHVGDYFPPRVQSNIVTAWIAGDDAKAERTFWRAFDKHYTEGAAIDQFTGITFE